MRGSASRSAWNFMKRLLAILVLAGGATYLYWNAQATPQTTPRPSRQSADNVFYLRRYFSFRTRKGVVGFLPGQEVTLNAAFDPVPGKVMVTDGRYTAAVSRELLTHDMDEADALLASDAQAQNMIAANLAETKQYADLAEQDLNAGMANGINSSSALMARQNTVGNFHSRLNEGPTWAGLGGTGGGGYYFTGAGARTTGSRPASAGAFSPAIPVASSSVRPASSSYHAPGLNYHGTALALDEQGMPQ